MLEKLLFQGFASSDGVMDAIRLTEIDASQLRRQMRRGSWTTAISLVGLVAAITFLVKGPLVSSAVLSLILLILAAFSALFIVGLVTTMGPVMSAFWLERLKTTQESLEVAEAMEGFQAAAAICGKIIHVEGESRLTVIEQHEAEMKSLAEAGEALPT